MNKLKYIITTLLFGSTVTLLAQNPEKTLDLGMGMQHKAQTSSFSIAEVDASVFEKNPYIDISKALYGKLAGMRITQGTGASADNISSISLHGRTPLILIDGYPRDIKDITASEIESIQVLTDAASTALYGMRGGNGVVLINTKRGKESDFKITADYHSGISTQFRTPEFADAYTYARSLNMALQNDGMPLRYNKYDFEAFQTGEYAYDYPNVDWWDETMNNYGVNHNIKLVFSNGSQNFKHHTVVDYYRDRSMLKQNVDDTRYSTKPTDTRLSIRSNMDVFITQTTELKLALVGKMQETRGTRYGRNAIFNKIYGTPSAAFPIKYENGIYGGSSVYGANNPVALLMNYGHERELTTSLLADMTLHQNLDVLTEGLSVEASVAFDNIGAMAETSDKEYRYMNSNAVFTPNGTLTTTPEIWGKDSEGLGHSQPFRNLALRNTLRAKAAYNRTFGKHAVNADLIFDYYNYIKYGRNNSGKNASVLANLAYTYDDRYSINMVFNHAGSAFLPDGHKWADYPAVSAAWTISNEGFMANAKNIDLLKLRASYGISGWDGNLRHEMWRQGVAGGGSYNFGTNVNTSWGVTEGPLPVVGLVAEKYTKATLGMDFNAFQNRLGLSVNGFYDKCSNSIVSGSNSVSGIIGIGIAQVNQGEYDYKGVDASLSWKDQIGKFHYGFGADASYLMTEIINDNEAYQEYDYLYHKGNRLGQYYGLQALGFFDNQQEINNSPIQTFSVVKPGDVKYKDQNGDNIIDNKDYIRMFGSSIPRFYFGFDLTLGYGGFEIYADFQGLVGKTINLLDSPLYQPLVNNGNISQTFLSQEIVWTEETKDTATMPRLTTLSNDNNYRGSSLWYRDGSYLKLRNLMVSYTFPKSMTKFADIKLYLQGTNLFSLDNIHFADPEQLGIAYPSTRCYWAGIKFNF